MSVLPCSGWLSQSVCARPPTRSIASSTTISVRPAWYSRSAAAAPAIPAPIIATLTSMAVMLVLCPPLLSLTTRSITNTLVRRSPQGTPLYSGHDHLGDLRSMLRSNVISATVPKHQLSRTLNLLTVLPDYTELALASFWMPVRHNKPSSS